MSTHGGLTVLHQNCIVLVPIVAARVQLNSFDCNFCFSSGSNECFIFTRVSASVALGVRLVKRGIFDNTHLKS